MNILKYISITNMKSYNLIIKLYIYIIENIIIFAIDFFVIDKYKHIV